MADAVVSLAPAQRPEEAPLDAAAIRSRVEELALKWRRGREEEEVPVAGAEADAEKGLSSMYEVSEVAEEAMDEWDSVSAANPSGDLGDLDAYLEWLRTKVSLTEEMNRKASDEIAVLAEATVNDAIQLDVGIEELESSLWKLDSKDLSHFEASPIVELQESTDLCGNESIVDKDYKYEVLKLNQQIEESEMDLKLLQNMERADAIWQLESLLSSSGAKILDFKDNCLRVLLEAPILTSDLIYEHKLDCAIDSFVSDHELLIEVGEGKEPQKVQIFPNDVYVDILIELLKSSRHSFEYFDKEETIVAHLVRGIDLSIKTPADWPLSSYGLRLISIRNSGTHPTNITSSLLEKTKELANGLELQIRRHLARFIDAVEEILVRELRSELHAGRASS
ncbi:hypothetical protein EJB05_37369 [Eragrostis curvula]|uniref:Uncharacterized protein n=1 Tax=Eragrostis curvula TaxID=38414 RepID=A0A5J9TRC2_9POAL|nr:hypothetical protein EJB05_37335 [Eragrostis curvula]TVU13930.1 hypothetical protein EJB05_37369 [Eragrostis curvula]